MHSVFILLLTIAVKSLVSTLSFETGLFDNSSGDYYYYYYDDPINTEQPTSLQKNVTDSKYELILARNNATVAKRRRLTTTNVTELHNMLFENIRENGSEVADEIGWTKCYSCFRSATVLADGEKKELANTCGDGDMPTVLCFDRKPVNRSLPQSLINAARPSCAKSYIRYGSREIQLWGCYSAVLASWKNDTISSQTNRRRRSFPDTCQKGHGHKAGKKSIDVYLFCCADHLCNGALTGTTSSSILRLVLFFITITKTINSFYFNN